MRGEAGSRFQTIIRNRWMGLSIVCMIVCALGISAGIYTYRSGQIKEEKEIGVVMWNGRAELYQAVDLYAETLEKELNTRIELIRCSGIGYVDYENMIERFHKQGGKVLINVMTEDIPEIMMLCEKYQIYFLQMWEMPKDTDILDKMKTNPYFLGYLISDEEKACRDMAEAMKKAGCQQVAVMTSMFSNINNNIHHLRCEEFENGLEPLVPTEVLEIDNFKDGMEYLKDLDIPLDGVLSSIGISYASLMQIKKEMNNPNLKFACFDADGYTAENLNDGNLIMMSCGQQNIFIFSVVYAKAFIDGGITGRDKITMVCPYIEVTSPEEYELYRKQCVESLPYSSKEIKNMLNSLEKGDEMLKEYALNFNVDWLSNRKND